MTEIYNAGIPDARSAGGGRALLEALGAAGFEEVGVQRRDGKLDGEGKGCVLVERLFGEAAQA